MGELKNSALPISSFFVSDDTSAAGYTGSCLILGLHSDHVTQFSLFGFSDLGNWSSFSEGDKFCVSKNSGMLSLKELLADADVAATLDKLCWKMPKT